MFELSSDACRCRPRGRRGRPAGAGCRRSRRRLLGSLLLSVLAAVHSIHAAAVSPLSPTAIVAAPDGKSLYVALATATAVAVVNDHGVVQRRIALPGAPSGLALSPDGTQLAVTCAAPQSVVCLVDIAGGKVLARMGAGHTAMAPVFSRDGATLYVCNRYHNEIAVFDVKARRRLGPIAVEREPVAAALHRDGRLLFVANHLPAMAADAPQVSAAISVIDTAARRIVKTLSLPNGSNLVLGIAVSPDGRYAAVTHNLARFYVPTTQVERGWMNTAALTLIDAVQLQVINTVLLDNLESGGGESVGRWVDGGRPEPAGDACRHARVERHRFPGGLRQAGAAAGRARPWAGA